jgi:hypothetical protein
MQVNIDKINYAVKIIQELQPTIMLQDSLTIRELLDYAIEKNKKYLE